MKDGYMSFLQDNTISVNIGQVHVCKKGTKNPHYTERENPLVENAMECFIKLWLGIPQSDIEFWCCPCEGGAYILLDPKNQIKNIEFWVNREKKTYHKNWDNSELVCINHGKVHQDIFDKYKKGY
jgi:hypothetical protein